MSSSKTREGPLEVRVKPVVWASQEAELRHQSRCGHWPPHLSAEAALIRNKRGAESVKY